MNDLNINWNDPSINAKNRVIPSKRIEPPIDEVISQIVGKKIYAQDPRLLKLIVKWKKGKSQDSMEADNFLQNPSFISELKDVLKNDLI